MPAFPAFSVMDLDEWIEASELGMVDYAVLEYERRLPVVLSPEACIAGHALAHAVFAVDFEALARGLASRWRRAALSPLVLPLPAWRRRRQAGAFHGAPEGSAQRFDACRGAPEGRARRYGAFRGVLERSALRSAPWKGPPVGASM